MPELIEIDTNDNKNESNKETQQAKKPLLKLNTTKTNKGKTSIPKRTTVSNTELYEAIKELIEENRKLNKIMYALLSLLQREVYNVIEEADDPILSKLPPKAKEVFVYIMELSTKKKYIPSMTIMARFNLTQEELFQLVNEINKVIQQYGFSIRFIEMDTEEEF